MIDPRKNLVSPSPEFPQRLRRSLGMLCLALGVVGCVLPILPGLPFMIVSARLLGPRDPLLRRLLMGCRRALRRLSRAEQPLLRRAGLRLTPRWRSLTRLLVGAR